MGQGTKEWLLCYPKFFDVVYEINAWMSVKHRPEIARAHKQWEGLKAGFDSFQIPYKLITPQEGLPDMVFTANGALVKDRKAVIASFRHPERQGESQHFEKWFAEAGYETLTLKTGLFEGEGDALFAGDTLFAGYGFRSSAETYDEICQLLDIDNLVLCEMVDPRFYHLDTCFAPINETEALFFPGAFTPEAVKNMERNINLIAVPESDAAKFACNTVIHEKSVIMPAGCTETRAVLEEKGYRVIENDMSEYLKSGGATKCCSLRI